MAKQEQQTTKEAIATVTDRAKAGGHKTEVKDSTGEGQIVRVEQEPGVYRETTVVGSAFSKPPMADGAPDLAGAPVTATLPKRVTIAAEPPTETLAMGRRPVSAREREAPAVRAATASAQANLSVALLRGGDRVVNPVDCVDIYKPTEIIELQAGAVVPKGKVLIPRNLVNQDALAE